MKAPFSREEFKAAQAKLVLEQHNFYPDIVDWPAIFLQRRSTPIDARPDPTDRSKADARVRSSPNTANISKSRECAGIGVMFNVINWAAVAYAKMYAAEMVGRKWTGGRLVDNPDPRWAIAASTCELLKQAVVDGFLGVSSPMQVAKAMQESAGFSKHAARLIAHTEAASAALHTLEASALSHGATHKRTSLSADHDHGDACSAAAAMGEVPIDFTYPGGMRIPLFHPGCRCSISFYVRKRR